MIGDTATTDTKPDTVAVLRALRARGVKVWQDGAQLRYQAPKGVLDAADIAHLRASKSQIIEALIAEGAAVGVVRPDEAGGLTYQAPLAWSQLAHARAYRLERRPAIRQIAGAVRMNGPLKIEALKASIVAIVQRHDALRTRIKLAGAASIQIIEARGHPSIDIRNLSASSIADPVRTITDELESLIMTPIDVSVDPLFAVRLLKLHEHEHVLMVALEHTIADAVSRSILIDEILTAYAQIATGQSISLSAIGLQFPQYALLQRSSVEAWTKRHASYWTKHLGDCDRLRFPRVRPHGPGEEAPGWDVVPLTLSRELKDDLSAWCRRNGTTIAMSLFAAYACVTLRWCHSSDGVFAYQSDGRSDARLKRTIGYCAAMLYLRICLHERESFLSFLKRVTLEYCSAFEHADHSYLASQHPEPTYLRNPSFNWIPLGTQFDGLPTEGGGAPLQCSSVPFSHPMMRTLDLDHEPMLVLYETADGVMGSLYFPKDVLEHDAMTDFVLTFMSAIRTVLTAPTVATDALCSE